MTLYLDGPVPVPNSQNRALSRELAIAGHDYFEVAFYWQSGSAPSSSDVIVRTSWELYKDAHIRGVRGKGAGEGAVDYSSNAVLLEVTAYRDGIIGYNPDGTPIIGPLPYSTTTPALTAGQGAAILFVGRKTDKTLLGVGKLILAERADGTATGTSINSDTASVTFEVAPLDCGVGDANYPLQPGESGTSFLTNFNGNIVNAANTNRYKIELADTEFDIFKLRDISNGGTNVTSAEYHFRTNGAAIGGYTNGIIVSGAGAYEKKQPRYPTLDGGFQYFSVILDDRTIITPRNNIYDPAADTSGGVPFKNPIELVFETTFTEPGSMFAFVFQIPVCPLFLNAEAGTWYIRASYDSYWLDLDSGGGAPGTIKGAGGAVLLSTGTVSEASGYRIRVVVPPNKYLYTASGSANAPDDPNSRYFNVNGLLVALEYYSGEHIRYLSNDELYFHLASRPIIPRDGGIPGQQVSAVLWGLQTVYVYYYHPQSGITHLTSFLIIVDNPSDPGRYTNIPSHHYIVIDNTVAVADLPNYLNIRFENNTLGRTSTFVIIFDNSHNGGNGINFPDGMNMQFLNNSPTVIICVAARPTTSAIYQPDYEDSVRVGRQYPSSATANGAFRVWGTENTFYFGKWPFNVQLNGYGYGSGPPGLVGTQNRYSYQETINVPDEGPRIVHKTYNYILSAYGPGNGLVAPPAGGPQYGNTGVTNAPFLRDGQGGKLYNIVIDPEITINFRAWLY